MIHHMIGTLLQTKVGLILGGVILITLAVSILFYLQLAISLLWCSTYSIVKKLVEEFQARKAARTANDLSWHRLQLGVTLPDGGEPVSEKKEEKES